jgi:pimeloyl-ACP methyl ester carboxylesterase
MDAIRHPSKGRHAMPSIETADGTNLHYRDWGTGAPVVFVHGGQLGAGMWEYQTVSLAEAGLRCVACDRRGCGRSDQPWGGYDYDTLAGDLAALLDRLDLRGVTLVGHSMGCGDIARYLSRRGAGRVARVALVAPTLPFLLKSADNPGGMPPAAVEAAISSLREDRPAAIAAGAVPFFGSPGTNATVSDATIRWGIGLALRASPRATIEMTRACFETDLRPDLAAFTLPTLVIHGAEDRTAPLDVCGRSTAAAIPGARLEVYDTGHGLFITEKDRLNGDLIAFAGG